MAMPEQTPAYRRVVGALWNFICDHLLFIWPVVVQELREGSPEYLRSEAELAAATTSLRRLSDDGLELMVGALKDELSRKLASLDNVRSRAGQLLAATGFVAVLASIGSSLPATKTLIVLTYVLMGLAVYGLLGTLWLSTQAVRVRRWELTILEPALATTRELQERYAAQLYRTCKRDALRLEVPTRYLSDAQWYFFATIAVIVALVVLHF
jgi:hypothetical protein